jgi:hypothetical protein
VFTYTLVATSLAQVLGAAAPAVDVEKLDAFLSSTEKPDYEAAVDRLADLRMPPGAAEVATVHRFAEQVGYRAIVEFVETLGVEPERERDSFPSFDAALVPARDRLTQPDSESADTDLARCLGRLVDSVSAAQLCDFNRAVRDAAADFDRPGKGVERPAQTFANEWGPRMRVNRVRTTTGPGWVWRALTLLERAAIEMLELAASRPRVRVCSLCGRIFVPRRQERHCAGHLWTWPDARFVAYCRRDHEPKPSHRTAHERERDRTYQEIRRLLKTRDGLKGEAAAALDRRIARLRAERVEILLPRGPRRQQLASAVPELENPEGV